MLKTITTLAIITATASTILAMEPHVKTNEEVLKRDGVEYKKTNYKLYFDNATIDLLTLRKKGDKALKKQKWGDFRMGLQFGRPNGTNGGWSLWNFFDCFVKLDGKYKNAPQLYQPENVYLTNLSDGTVLAEIISPLSADAKLGKMSMRFMKFPSHPTWLFMRVRFIDSTIPPWRMGFSAYPGNSNSPKERERWGATRESKQCLKTKGFSITPTSDALVMYSRYVHERFGNYLVFNHNQFKKIFMPSAVQGSSAQFFPKKGEKEFIFALGYFMDKSPSDELPRFLGETQDNIRKFMNEINWSPKIDVSRFNKLKKETVDLLNALKNAKIGYRVYETSFTETIKEFDQSTVNGDFNTASKSLATISALNEEIAKKWLSQLK